MSPYGEPQPQSHKIDADIWSACRAENQQLRAALRLVSIWADEEGARMPVALVAFVREALAGDTE